MRASVTHQEGFFAGFPSTRRGRYQRESPRISELVRFDDAFIKEINHDFFKADFDYPIRTFVLTDQAQYEDFVNNQLRVPGPAGFGIYLYSNKVLATYEDSGLGTFAHEILYPLVERNLSSCPPWAVEGIPAFFEKFYGYWENDKLVLFWGFQNPWPIEELGASVINLELPKIIGDDNPTDRLHAASQNQSELRIVSIFLWEQGKFTRFLRLIAAKDKRGYTSYHCCPEKASR